MTVEKNPQDKFLKILTWVMFVFCMMVLTRYILLKGGPDHYKMYFSNYESKNVLKKGIKRANFVPFSTLQFFYRMKSSYSYYVAKNILGNIIGFIPLGILLPIMSTRLQRILRTTGVVFLISLSFETIQLITNLGVFDVDDLILNTIGGAIGYLIYSISKRLMYMNTATGNA